MFEPGHRTDRRPPFRFAVYTRVAFSDTDAQGVVYYGRYLPYFDLARTEYHRSLGHDRRRRARGVRHARLDRRVPRPGPLRRPARGLRPRPADRATSVTYDHAAYRLDDGDGDVLMVTAKQTVVLIDHDDRSTLPVPDAFRGAVAGFEGTDGERRSRRSRILTAGGEPDDVLRGVVAALVDSARGVVGGDPLRRERRPGARPGGRRRRERGGRTCPGSSTRATPVAELAAEGCSDRALLERVAGLIAEHCLVGWDTGGAPWEPQSRAS